MSSPKKAGFRIKFNQAYFRFRLAALILALAFIYSGIVLLHGSIGASSAHAEAE